jgi:hypothetical protein
MSCPVCFGGEDAVVRESLNAGIGVLLGVTGMVLACFGGFFVSLARRSQAMPAIEDPRAPGAAALPERTIR